MIGLILGTSEGKKILSLLNEKTEEIWISTATSYGGELLKEYRYKTLNTKPLNKEGLIEELRKNKVQVLIDGSHPYAAEITENAVRACETLKIPYLRYERPSVLDKFHDEKIIEVSSYEEFAEKVEEIIGTVEGTILNTTGSRNIEKLLNLNIKHRMIHRVLPSLEVMEQCFALGVKVEDFVAMKGPVGYELNCGFIKQYNGIAMLLKDSGPQGGTEEKIKAALDSGIYAFVIGRKKERECTSYYSEEAVVQEALKKLEEEYV